MLTGLAAEDFEKAHAFFAPSLRANHRAEELRLHYAVLARRQVVIRAVFFAFEDPSRATVAAQQRCFTDGTVTGLHSDPIGTSDELWEKHEG